MASNRNKNILKSHKIKMKITDFGFFNDFNNFQVIYKIFDDYETPWISIFVSDALIIISKYKVKKLKFA